MRVLITGASSGIGYKIGVELAKRGHLVYMTCRSIKEVFCLRKKLELEGVSAVCFKLDLLTDDIYLVRKLEIDCLVNQAGIGVSGSLLTMDDKGLREVYETNIFRSFLLLKEVYWQMKKRNIMGKIFVTSSLISLFPIPFLGVYSSSKAAISLFSSRFIYSSIPILYPSILDGLSSFAVIKIIGDTIQFCLIEPGAYKTGFNQVMVDSFYNYSSLNTTIPIYQRKLFALLESKNMDRLVFKIVKEIEHKKTKKILRVPFLQGVLLKIYGLFFG